MLNHRPLIRSALLALALCAGFAGPAAAGPASSLIEQFNLTFIDIMRTDDRTLAPGQPGRYRRLSEHLSESFDLGAMMERAAGAQWAAANEQDRAEAVDAFLRWNVGTYLGRFERYAGEYFQIVDEEQGRDGVSRVVTKLIRPGRFNVPVTYVVRRSGGEMRIVDVTFVGGTSEVAARKSEFAETLNRSGLSGLIVRLNDQADKTLSDLRITQRRDAAQRTFASTN